MLSIPSGEHHETTGSSSSVSANPISNPAQPGNTVNVPVGTPPSKPGFGWAFSLEAVS